MTYSINFDLVIKNFSATRFSSKDAVLLRRQRCPCRYTGLNKDEKVTRAEASRNRFPPSVPDKSEGLDRLWAHAGQKAFHFWYKESHLIRLSASSIAADGSECLSH